jgi:hypothetical protein
MKKITVVIFFLIIFLNRNSYSQNTYEFLNVDMSPRAGALGGSFVSNGDDPNVIFYNPAGLNLLQGNPASISYVKHLLDINFASVAFSTNLAAIGRMGAAIQYVNYGSFDGADDNGQKTGPFSAGEAALILGYANNLDTNFYYGVNLKLIYSNIANRNSDALAFDAGLHYAFPKENADIGFAILNVGTQLKSYYTTKENLPLDVVFGVSKSLAHLPLRLSLDFHELNEKHNNFATTFRAFSIGAEFTLSKVLKLRFGYDNQKRQDWQIGSTPGIAGFNIGLGLHIAGYQFDYGYSSLGLAGGLQRIGISTNI